MMPWSCGGWQLPNNMDDLDLRHIQGEASQIPIRCLPQSCRKFLSDVLDPESTLGRSDYRRFAELLGLSHFQTEGCRARNRDRSITGILLTEFGQQPIWRLLTILREMDVAGVREILNSWQEIRGNYHTEQSQLAGGYQGGVQNTESLCTCMNCPAFPSHQNRDTWGYPYIPPHPQDESCHIRGQARQSVMHTPPSQQAWQQPRTSPEGLKGGEGQEDARGKMAGQDAGMKGMQEARPGAMRNITELTQTGPDRCNEKLFLANNQRCRDDRQGSLQRMMSNEDNCSYGIEWGEDEPINAGIRNNGLGDGNSTQNNGLADGNSTQNNGTGNANSTQNSGLGDGNSTQNNGLGDGNSTQNNGLADGNSTQNNGTGNANSTQNNGLGDVNSTQNNGLGDGNSTQKNGTGDGNSTQYNGTCTNLLLNQGDHNSQEELGLTQNGPGNSLSIPDNNDWLPPADWDSISTSVKTFLNKASKASRQSPMAHDIARNEHTSSTPQMANRNNGKPVTLYPLSADKSAPQKSSICPSTYPNYMPTDTRGHAYSSSPYAYSEFGNPYDEHDPSYQTLQKGYLYQYNGAPRTYHGPLQTYHRAPQPIQGVPQTIQGVPSNNQCVPQPIQGGQFQMVSQIPHRYNTRSPPQHATGRGSHFVQQRGLDARNWQVPHTSEIPTATQTHPVASQLYQYLHDVPAAAVPVPRGHSNRQSDRPPQVEDGPGFSEKDQVKLRGQDLRQGTEKRHSDPAVREEVIAVCQHRRHGSDEGGAVYGREAESGHRGREKYVFITGGDMQNQEAVAKEMEKICHELHKHSITAVADLPNKVKAVPRDPLQGSNSLSFRRDNIHEARMAYFERATCVLMIVSPGYKEYVDKDNDQAQARPSEHQSSTRHIYTLMLTEYCEKNFSKNKRFYPVCLAKLKTKRSDIPDWITSTLTYCFPGKELFQHLKQDLENN